MVPHTFVDDEIDPAILKDILISLYLKVHSYLI